VASVRQRSKRKSCAALRRRARRIENRRKRKAALKRLPPRCRPPRKPTRPTQPITTPGTQPAVPQMPPSSGTPSPGTPVPPPSGGLAPSPIAVYGGTFGVREAERLLWRAGFGPRPGEAAQLAALGLEGAVSSLTRVGGPAPMDGPEPVADGAPLDPYATWGHDHLWWLDRMVRSRHQLVERMALVWHDWFATSDAGVGSRRFMLEQNDLFRTQGLGNFDALLKAVTVDRAMLVWLSGLDNRRGAINENYARELMELFTLGADRGAYTEQDVRELARALSGWRADWVDGEGLVDFRFDARRWDAGDKTVFGRTGAFDWQDACRLVTEHPMHPSFFVAKLWSYFIPVAPSDAQVEALAGLYTSSGHEIRPVLEAILRAPELYTGPRMVKPAAVFAAGLMRATGRAITSDNWVWMCAMAGQQLFHPPDVSGWDDTRWLDTSTMAGRWTLVNESLRGLTATPDRSYPAETPEQALRAARDLWNDPPLTDETLNALREWSASAIDPTANGWMRAYRANALKMLVGMCPDHHTA
jgi:hypothetical protein